MNHYIKEIHALEVNSFQFTRHVISLIPKKKKKVYPQRRYPVPLATHDAFFENHLYAFARMTAARLSAATVTTTACREPRMLLRRMMETVATEVGRIRPYAEIPGPTPVPFLGNTWRFIPFIGECTDNTVSTCTVLAGVNRLVMGKRLLLILR